MMNHYENCKIHFVVATRAIQTGRLGTGGKHPVAIGITCADYPNGCRVHSKQGYRVRTGYFPTDRSTLAGTISGPATRWAGKGCSPSWSHSRNIGPKDPGSRRSNPSYDTPQCNPVEQPHDGQGSRIKRGDHTSHLEATQPTPHLIKTFKVGRDKHFVEKLYDVAGLYLNPPDKSLLLCVDGKSQIQALDRTPPGLPMKKGRCGTMTHDYKRNGTTTLFAALSMLDGTIIGDCLPRHRHQEFIRFLKKIDAETPSNIDLHVIVDNYGTHKHPSVINWLTRHPRFNLHFIPTSSSWVNMVERWFREITDKRIRRGSFKNVQELITAIKTYIDNHNQNPQVFVWTASVAQISTKVAKSTEALDALH
jgi:transposase